MSDPIEAGGGPTIDGNDLNNATLSSPLSDPNGAANVAGINKTSDTPGDEFGAGGIGLGQSGGGPGADLNNNNNISKGYSESGLPPIKSNINLDDSMGPGLGNSMGQNTSPFGNNNNLNITGNLSPSFPNLGSFQSSGNRTPRQNNINNNMSYVSPIRLPGVMTQSNEYGLGRLTQDEKSKAIAELFDRVKKIEYSDSVFRNLSHDSINRLEKQVVETKEEYLMKYVTMEQQQAVILSEIRGQFANLDSRTSEAISPEAVQQKVDKAIDVELERRRVIDSIRTLNTEMHNKLQQMTEYVNQTGGQLEKIFADNMKKANSDLKQYIDVKCTDLGTEITALDKRLVQTNEDLRSTQSLFEAGQTDLREQTVHALAETRRSTFEELQDATKLTKTLNTQGQASLSAAEDRLTEKIKQVEDILDNYRTQTVPDTINSLKDNISTSLQDQAKTLEGKMFTAISLRKEEAVALAERDSAAISQLMNHYTTLSQKTQSTAEALEGIKYHTQDALKKASAIEELMMKKLAAVELEAVQTVKKGLEEMKSETKNNVKNIGDSMEEKIKELSITIRDIKEGSEAKKKEKEEDKRNRTQTDLDYQLQAINRQITTLRTCIQTILTRPQDGITGQHSNSSPSSRIGAQIASNHHQSQMNSTGFNQPARSIRGNISNMLLLSALRKEECGPGSITGGSPRSDHMLAPSFGGGVNAVGSNSGSANMMSGHLIHSSVGGQFDSDVRAIVEATEGEIDALRVEMNDIAATRASIDSLSQIEQRVDDLVLSRSNVDSKLSQLERRVDETLSKISEIMVSLNNQKTSDIVDSKMNTLKESQLRKTDEIKNELKRLEVEITQARCHCVELTTSQVREAMKHTDTLDNTNKDKIQILHARIDRMESYNNYMSRPPGGHHHGPSADAILNSVFAAAERRGRGL